ncbi:hypothetical protein D3C72_725250 [compost metagenome]
MQTHHIAHVEQIGQMLNLGRIPQRQFVFDIVEKDVHPERFRQNTELRTDMAVADDPQLFTTRFKRARGQFVPHAAVGFGVGFRNAAQQEQQLANH